MGIERTEMYVVSCDRCEEYYEDLATDTQQCFLDLETANKIVQENEWHKNGDKYYCRNCYTIDEDTDEVTIKP